MTTTLDNLADIEAELRNALPDHDAVSEALRRINEEFRAIKFRATVALNGAFDMDLRGEMLIYLRANARLHGQPVGQRIRELIEDRDPWFMDLALAAWGVVL